jgi:putative serine protease PepD
MLEAGLAVLVGVVLGIGAHVWLGPAGGASPAPAEVAGASVERVGAVPDEVQAVASTAVLEVHAAGCGARRQASATYVTDADGSVRLLTNAHVVRGSSSVRVVLPDGGSVELDVLGALVDRDAALLDAEPLRDRSAAAAPTLTAGDVAGAPVVVAGHPAGAFRLDATTVADVQRRAGYGGVTDVLLADTTAEGGHSGGAVLDPSGAVIGLVAARDPSTGRVVAYAIEDLGSALGPVPSC